MTRSAFITLAGKPNAGKSTLLNAIVGTKIAAVSAKPQTTRNRISGIVEIEDCQLVFYDTPGIHRRIKHKMNTAMNDVAWNSLAESELSLLLIDACVGITEDDIHILKRLMSGGSGRIGVVISKTDKIKKEQVTEVVCDTWKVLKEEIDLDSPSTKERFISEIIIESSAKDKTKLAGFIRTIANYSVEAPWFFSEGTLTDLSVSDVASEMIREQLFRKLSEEIPYGCGVRVDKISEGKNGVTIEATIVVAKESYKRIIVGKQGSVVKAIGTQARLSLERFLDKHVRLELYVKVSEDWINDSRRLAEFASL